MGDLAAFEDVVRRTTRPVPVEDPQEEAASPHPFESRNIHPDLPKKVRQLFDNGFYPESAFEAFKFVEKEVKRISHLRGKTGYALMMAALNETNPAIRLNPLVTESEKDEQLGYKNMFAGAQSGIRNPRGHETDITDSPDLCLDHLSIASVLLRKLDDAGVRSV